MRFQASSKRARFLERIQPALGVLLRQDEASISSPTATSSAGLTDRRIEELFGGGNDSLGLVADVDEHLVLVHAHDRPVDDLPLVYLGESRLVIGNELAVRAGDPDAGLGLLRSHIVGSHRQRPVSIAVSR